MYMYFDNQDSRVIMPTLESTLVFSPILPHVMYYMPQSKHTHADFLEVMHHFLTNCLLCLH